MRRVFADIDESEPAFTQASLAMSRSASSTICSATTALQSRSEIAPLSAKRLAALTVLTTAKPSPCSTFASTALTPSTSECRPSCPRLSSYLERTLFNSACRPWIVRDARPLNISFNQSAPRRKIPLDEAMRSTITGENAFAEVRRSINHGRASSMSRQSV